MLFSSATFIYLFLPIVLFFYYVPFRKNRTLQNIFLFIASLGFYAWGEPKFVFVMMLSIVMNWFFGLLLGKVKSNLASKCIVALSVIFNLGILFVFKYLTFVNRIFGSPLSLPNIILPIGISFFTFQAMSYVIDVYRGNAEVQKNLLYVGLYISFFPQLIAGPIVRYKDIEKEIISRKETKEDFFNGFARFIVGLGKKVLLANSFAFIVDTAFGSTGSISVTFSWLGALAYTMQIFFDFCGYSDMAIGLSRMFGFHLKENFNYPYISLSVSEFWRRWHMSLGTWFRDYVYIPLGGNRNGKWKTERNLLIVWLLTGLWHGANFTFILWGLLYFVVLTIEKLMGIEKKEGKAWNVFKWLYTFLLVMFGWVLFRSDSIKDAGIYFSTMFGVHGNIFSDAMFVDYFKQIAVTMIIGVVFCTPLAKIFREKTKDNIVLNVVYGLGLTAILVFSIASLVSSSYNPFIYFNF